MLGDKATGDEICENKPVAVNIESGWYMTILTIYFAGIVTSTTPRPPVSSPPPTLSVKVSNISSKIIPLRSLLARKPAHQCSIYRSPCAPEGTTGKVAGRLALESIGRHSLTD